MFIYTRVGIDWLQRLLTFSEACHGNSGHLTFRVSIDQRMDFNMMDMIDGSQAGHFTKTSRDSHIFHYHMRFIAGFISIHALLKYQIDWKNTTVDCFDWSIAS